MDKLVFEDSLQCLQPAIAMDTSDSNGSFHCAERLEQERHRDSNLVLIDLPLTSVPTPPTRGSTRACHSLGQPEAELVTVAVGKVGEHAVEEVGIVGAKQSLKIGGVNPAKVGLAQIG